MRPTLMDLADAAGVSTATVDRVLNNRPGVAARTRAIVTNTARRIGYLPEVKGDETPIQLAALLPPGTNSFIAELRAHLIAAATTHPGITLSVPDIADTTPEAMAHALGGLQHCQGAAVIAQNHPLVHEALRRAATRGVPIVTLATDLPDTRRLAYIGIDDMRAGRLAGQVLSRFLGNARPAKISVFTGLRGYRGHMEREMGLRQVIEEEAPHLDVLAVRESHEDRTRASEQTKAVLAAHPDLSAIYNAGGGTLGIARALKEAGRAGDMVFVAHDATDMNKSLLLDGTLDAVIDQDARLQAHEAITTLAAAARGTNHAVVPPRLQLILKENLPTDTLPGPSA